MKAGTLRVVTASYVAAIVWFFGVHHASVGFFAAMRSGSVRIEVGTSPGATLLGIAGIVLFCLSMWTEVRFENFRPAPLWRRFAAFLVDFWVALFIITAADVFLPLLLEARRTGVLRWHFERNYLVPTDAVGLSLVVVSLGAMCMYFAWPLALGRQTPGCLVLRIAMLKNGEKGSSRVPFGIAIERTTAEFRGVCALWRTIRERDSQGRTWYDRETGFAVVSY